MTKIYGYCRISTAQQSIDRQVRNIKAAYPEAIIIEETFTGTTQDRPRWSQLQAKLQPGDTVVFDSVSRMSRNADEGISTYMDMYSRGVELIFLKECHINTATYKRALQSRVALTGDKVDIILQAVNQYLMELAKDQIKMAFDQAQKEVDDLHQRTKEGMETARLAGKRIGRQEGDRVTTHKSVAAKEIIRKHCKEYGGSLSDPECIQLAGVSRNTFYKYKKELREEALLNG